MRIEQVRARVSIAPLVVVAAALGASLSLTGCTGGGGHASSSTSTAAADAPTAGDRQCGKARASADSSILSPQSIGAPMASAVGRSVATVSFAATGCRPVISAGFPPGACASGSFPWTWSAGTLNEELYSRGVGTLTEATFDVSGRPVLKQWILRAAPKGNMLTRYVDHVLRCGGKSLASSDGRPVLVALGGASGLLLHFDDARIVALRPLDGRPPSALVPVMARSVGTG